MKSSIFNSCIPICGRHSLLHNSLSNNFLVIKDQIIASEDLYDMESLPESLQKKLVETGMIVEDGKDEVQILADLIESSDNNDDEFLLYLNPTLDCNFKCWYCYERHSRGEYMKGDVVQNVRQFCAKIIREKKIVRFRLSLFGGEPLLYFNKVTRPLIEFLACECSRNGVSFSLQFTSNGALLNSAVIEFLKSYDCYFQITLDGGKSEHDATRFFCNGEGSYKKIVRNIKSLLNVDIFVNVRVNFTAANVNSIDDIFHSFLDLEKRDKANLCFDFQRVWQERVDDADETESKAQEMRNKFRSAGFAVATNYLVNSVKNSCYGDKKNSILINYDGRVFGCTARDFNDDNCVGYLGERGEINFKHDVWNRRSNSKFKKEVCRKCRIAPLCGGGCKQRAYEAMDSGGCAFGYTEEDKDRKILDLFEHFCMNSAI